jgi:hypothetical protein
MQWSALHLSSPLAQAEQDHEVVSSLGQSIVFFQSERIVDFL